MFIRHLYFFLFVLILFCNLSSVQASDRLSNLSGKAGTSTSTIKKPSTDILRSLRTVIWYEGLDRPCRFRLEFAAAVGDSTDAKELKLCSRAMTNKDSAMSIRAGSFGIVAAQVCLNRSGNRLKGLKLGYREKAYNPSRFTGPVMTRGKKRSRCHKWYPAARCTGNDSAVGMHFHYSGSSVSGLQLVCDEH